MPYRVLPRYAGLAQLVGEGKLELASPDARGGIYRILHGMDQFPADLCSNLRVDFLLPENVTLPAGSPCASTVTPVPAIP